MPRKKMTPGQKKSLEARKALKEYRPTLPTGKYDAQGNPIMERKSFYYHPGEKHLAEAAAQDYLRTLLVAPKSESGPREGTVDWYLVHRYAPLKADAKHNTRRAIQLASDHLSDHAGHLLAKDFKAPELAKVLAKVGKSASLRNQVRLVALEINDLAAEEDPEVRLISRRRVKPAKQRAPKVQVQTPRECLAVALSVPEQYRPAALFMAAFGLRGGEAVAPLWSDVTPLGSLMVVRQEDDEGGAKEELKSENAVREIPIPKAMATLLAELREGQRTKGLGKPSDPISATRNGTPVSENNSRRAVQAARTRLEMPAYKGRPQHIFRHSLATWLDTNGCPEGVRLALLGQSRDAVKDRYVHASTADMLPWLERWWTAATGAEPKERVWRGGTRTPSAGEKNGRAKMTQAKADAMREDLKKPGATLKTVAETYGISERQARDIREGKVWISEKVAEGVS